MFTSCNYRVVQFVWLANIFCWSDSIF